MPRPSMNLGNDQINVISDLADSEWWASSIDLFSAIGIDQKDVASPVSVLAQAIPINDAYRRRVNDPSPYLAGIYEYAELLKQCSADMGKDVVSKKQFLEWLAAHGFEPFKHNQQWRTISSIARVRRPSRERPVMSFGELVNVVDRFLSEERAGRYTLPDFRKWCLQWHGSTLFPTVTNVVGGGSWLTTKGVVFDMHKDDKA